MSAASASSTLSAGDALAEALADRRVVRALALAVRDIELRRRFRALRAGGAPVQLAVEALLGPHLDERGRPYYLSEERVRGVVYRKGRVG